MRISVLSHFTVSYSVCPTGVWGKHCSRPCQCQNEGVCDSVNGGCDCPPGWIGSHCEVGENIPQLHGQI